MSHHHHDHGPGNGLTTFASAVQMIVWIVLAVIFLRWFFKALALLHT